MMGGVARDIFVDYAVVELLFDTALTNLDVSHITKADSAAQTFSAVSHQLILITVPEWRTGQHIPRLQRATATHRGCMAW